MSTKPETTFIARVHRHLSPTVYRMKNHNPYVGGIADVWYDGPKADLWIEYKWLVLPKRDATLITLVGGKNPMLSHLQQQWLQGRHDNNRNVAVVVGTPEGAVWFNVPSALRPEGLLAATWRASLMTVPGVAAKITEKTTYG